MDWVCGKSSMLSSARVGCTVQLVSSNPSTRSWSVDSSAVGLAQIHGTGSRRHVLTAQQNILEVRCGPPGDVSFQCYGHHGRYGQDGTIFLELNGPWQPCFVWFTWTWHGGCWLWPECGLLRRFGTAGACHAFTAGSLHPVSLSSGKGRHQVLHSTGSRLAQHWQQVASCARKRC